MIVLEDLFVDAKIDGIVPNRTVKIHGKIELALGRTKVWYKYDDEPDGPGLCEVLTRDHEAILDIIEIGKPVAGPPDRNPDHPTLSGLMRRSAIVLPLRLEAPYLDEDGVAKTFPARVYRDGYIVHSYKVYATLRAAANDALKSIAEKSGRPPKQLQGDPWDFWRFRDQDGTLLCVRVLRDTNSEDQADNQAYVGPLGH